MDDITEFLEKNPIQYISTIGLDDRPKVRPIKFRVAKGDRLYFATSNKKPVYEELEKLPYLELSASNNDYQWLRIAGKVVFSDDMKIKQEILDNHEDMQNIYESPENPELAPFYIRGTAVISDLAGSIPMKYTLY